MVVGVSWSWQPELFLGYWFVVNTNNPQCGTPRCATLS